MGTFEMTISVVATIESNCPTNISATYDDDVVTILTNYMENEMEITTDTGETVTYYVKNTQLILERYKHAQLQMTLSTQFVANDYYKVRRHAKRVESNFKNGIYEFHKFLLYNDEEDEIYHCYISTIEEICIPVERIIKLEVAV